MSPTIFRSHVISQGRLILNKDEICIHLNPPNLNHNDHQATHDPLPPPSFHRLNPLRPLRPLHIFPIKQWPLTQRCSQPPANFISSRFGPHHMPFPHRSSQSRALWRRRSPRHCRCHLPGRPPRHTSRLLTFPPRPRPSAISSLPPRHRGWLHGSRILNCSPECPPLRSGLWGLH